MKELVDGVTVFSRLCRRRGRIQAHLSRIEDKPPGKKVRRAAKKMLADIEAMRAWLDGQEEIATLYSKPF
jgi:hypothetical protein